MRRDLIIGIIVSVAIHVGAAFSGNLSRGETEAAGLSEDDSLVEVFIPPPLPVEEPEVVETNEPTAEVLEFTPPMQQDLPQLTTPDSFTQPVQPPPDNMQPNATVVKIPEGEFDVGEIFDISMLDTPPQALVQQSPQYPVAMRKQGVRGEVTIRFIVTNTGDVTAARVISSSQREFEREALSAVEKWKFKPGRKGGRNVATWMEVPLIFSIR